MFSGQRQLSVAKLSMSHTAAPPLSEGITNGAGFESSVGDGQRPPPPRLNNGQIPEFFDDEESGYQFYIDDQGEAQWDLFGYYDLETKEYVYYEDVVEEEGTYVFGKEKLPNFLGGLVPETLEAETISHIYGAPVEKKEETEEERKARHRIAVLKEIINTEKDYVRHLTVLTEKYMQPALTLGLINNQEKSTIFSNVPLIVGVNNMLLGNLLQVNELTGISEKGETISDIFSNTAEYFKMYSTYCTNYPPAVKYVGNLIAKNSAFELFCKEVKDSSTERLDIIDLLIKPVQRICKYPLLFRELLRNTDETHPEYEKLNQVLAKLQDVAEHVNESKRNAENLQEILDISNQMDGAPENFGLVAPTRRILLRDGVRVAVNGGHPKSFEVFLFSDIILLAKKKLALAKKKYLWKMCIEIQSTVMHDVTASAESVDTGGGATQQQATNFSLELRADGVDLVVYFKDQEEKNKWKEAMRSTKLHLQEEELKKIGEGKPRRRAPGGTRIEGGPGGGGAGLRPRLNEGNLLKTVGGKRGVGNIEAFRSKHVNSTSNTNNWNTFAAGIDRDSIVIGEVESESAGLEKLKKAVEVEEEKKEKLAKEIGELEESVSAVQKQLAAQQAKNAELERAIQELRGKGGHPDRRN